MRIYIKYMVSQRCKMVVEAELKKVGIDYRSIEVGSVEVDEPINVEILTHFGENLLKFGLELLDDKKGIIIEKIKNVVIEMIHYADEMPKENFSTYISNKLGYDYTYIANIFSEISGSTLHHFIISHKIEKIKELLIYDELNMSEIANKLGYNSSAHLSTQFKNATGLTPSFYKKIKKKREIH